MSETKSERIVETAIVTANWRKNCPEMPATNALGTNTAQSTRLAATTAPPTSSIARRAASTGARPSESARSTFSTTTIASSTTIPIASTRPKSERMLSEKPSAAIAANVPTSETGIATSGITLARQFCRKTSTTTTTSATASYSVVITSRIDSATNRVGS